jgi:hypothetical protein
MRLEVAKTRGRAGAKSSAEKMYHSINKMLSPHPFVPGGSDETMKGGKRRGVPVKTLKKLLKKAGLKTTGKKAALTRRAKKAKLVMKGGIDGMQSDTDKALDEPLMTEDDTMQTPPPEPTKGGRKRKSRGKKELYGMGYGMY